jgi:ABC-type microcin C transport system permease subunit YejB
MRTLLSSIAAILLLVTVAIAQVAPGAPVTCAALIKQFDDKIKIIQPTEEGKKLRDQAEADSKDNKEEDCNKNIKAAIKTLKK